MIYGRFGDPVAIVRLGTLDDVQSMEGRKPDQADRAAVEIGSYVVVRYLDDRDGRQTRLYHQAYLRADDGSREITAAIEALQAVAS